MEQLGAKLSVSGDIVFIFSLSLVMLDCALQFFVEEIKDVHQVSIARRVYTMFIFVTRSCRSHHIVFRSTVGHLFLSSVVHAGLVGLLEDGSADALARQAIGHDRHHVDVLLKFRMARTIRILQRIRRKVH